MPDCFVVIIPVTHGSTVEASSNRCFDTGVRINTQFVRWLPVFTVKASAISAVREVVLFPADVQRMRIPSVIHRHGKTKAGKHAHIL